MIDKLEKVMLLDGEGNEYAERLPNNEEVIKKVNEIIEFLNAQPTLLDK